MLNVMSGYKTIALNSILGLLIVAAQVISEFGNSPEFQYFITPETAPYVMLAILGANIFLRVITTGPVFNFGTQNPDA